MKTGTLLKLCRVQLASRKSPNGFNIYLRFTENGRQVKKSVGFVPRGNREAWKRMLEQGKILAQQFDAELTSSISGTLHITSRDKSFLQFIDALIETKTGTTRSSYLQARKHFCEFIHPATDVVFGNVTEDFCMRFKNHLLKLCQSGRLQFSSANVYYDKFKSVIHDACRRKLLAVDPVAHIRFSVVRQSRRFALTADEIRVLMSSDPKQAVIKHIFVFALCTALRIGDILSVRFSDVANHNGTPCLSFIAQKTRKPIVVPLNNVAREIIETQRQKALSADARIFHDAPRYRSVLNALQSWSEKTIGKRITPHVARHTAATLMLSKASLKDVSFILGHGDAAVTSGYLHATPRGVIDAVQSIENVLR